MATAYTVKDYKSKSAKEEGMWSSPGTWLKLASPSSISQATCLVLAAGMCDITKVEA